MKYKKTTLPNGLRVITIPTNGNPAVMVLVVVETGSNYETKAQNGLSHFLEHMCFKGTTMRPKASEIAKELDGLGAQNNAFTSNELTGYYAKAAKKHFAKLFEIISDLYLNPTLPAADLEKERGVILEEISMYEDQPQRNVWVVLSKLMYGETPAGRSILGPRENIKRFTRDNFVDYRGEHYVASKTVVIVAGDVSEQVVLREVNKNFKDIPKGKRLSKQVVRERQDSPGFLVYKKKTDQTHMVMAFRTCGARDKRTPALAVLTEILGKGMSSRLFTKLRDEMGACYYVRAGHDQYTDHGALTISTGINVSRIKEVVGVLLEECAKLANVLVSNEELQKAKEHNVGHLYMDLETTDSLAEFYADQEVGRGDLESPYELEKRLRAVTAKDVMKVAREIFKDNNLNLAIVGDIADSKPIKKVLTFK
ncbi:MAG: insulinase family protein [Candidatus Zambryskibacteria bacterium]|nr:insulinase family protein [Candidatus Zambryskibacteria bacterium]